MIFNFCFKCKKIICSKRNCQITHEKECGNQSQNFIPCKYLNSLCYEHGEKFLLYCPQCDKNICEKCEGHEEHKIKFMSQMKIDNKEIKLYNYKIEFTKNYLNYIENEINNFKKEWREEFERKMSYFEERTKTFLDKNKNQIKLIQNILNTYKLIGNISIENYKNIKKFCKFNEFKFILPGSINKKKEYIENFSYNQLIHERAKKKKGKKCCKSIESELNDKPNQITKANDEIILLTLNGLNELYQINKIENESKIKKALNLY